MASRDQRFMVDDALLDDIVGYAGLKPGDAVLDVGAGSGNLTEKIAAQVKVTAVEKDEALFKTLVKKFSRNPNVELVRGDATRMEYPIYSKIVSNIPYSVSRKLVEKFILEGFELAVLVVQREFAEKLLAAPGGEDYRMISALAQSTCDIEVLRDVPPQAFRPQPKVSSAVIRLTQRWRPPQDYPAYLKKLFSRKNKKVGNILDAPEEYREMRPGGMSPEEILEVYRRL